MKLFSLSVLTSLLFACASNSPDAGVTDAGVTAAVEPVSMGPQFYEVRGNGASAYLFGTVHLSDERTKMLPAAVNAAFEESDALYVELKPGMMAAMQMLKLTALPEGMSLDTLVGAETWERVSRRYEDAGRSEAGIDTLKKMAPWVVMSQIAFLDDYASGEPVLDRDFSLRAKEIGMPVHGLETIGEQLTMFTDLTFEEQATWFQGFLDKLDEYDAEGRSMGAETLDAWVSGDAESLYGLRDQVFSGYPGDPADLERKLLWNRNEGFADDLDKALRGAPGEVLFVAIGAMHLPNPPEADAAEERTKEAPRRLGLAEHLRLRGYTVTRLNPETGL